MIKLSIILPIYNVRKFIGLCLDSLYCQDIPEDMYEIICVNDGSSDNSSDVVKEYQTRHNNIILIEQDNSGVCVARNKGFASSSGEYVWFIDPDDMICSNCFGTIISELEKHNADVFEMEYETCEEDFYDIPKQKQIVIKGENKPGSTGSGWLYVCSSEYIRKNNISFCEKLSYGEDYLWAFQIKYREHKSIYTDESLYIYRQRGTSAMHIKSVEKTEKKMNDMLLLYKIYEQEYARCKKDGMSAETLKNVEQRKMLCIQAALLCFSVMGKSKKEINDYLRKLKKEKMYPYKPMFWYLKEKSLAPLKARLITFLLPFEPYFKLLCYLRKGK